MSARLPKWFQSILLSPSFLALPVTFFFILLLPDIFSKHKAGIVQSGFIDKKGGYDFYADLDNDGISEKIVLFNNTEGKASVKIISHEGFIRAHYYFNGQIMPTRAWLIHGQIDRKGTVGIFFFMTRNDSLLLNGIMPAEREKSIVKDRFICHLAKLNGRFDYTISTFLLCDLNGDGIREAIFSIMAGFPLQPRRLFAYNIATGELQSTHDLGVHFWIRDTLDVNGDGSPELLASSYAISNYPSDSCITLHDSCAWLMVFTSGLDFLFPPVPFCGTYRYFNTQFLQTGSGPRIVAVLTGKSSSTIKPRLILFDLHGKTVAEKVLGDSLASFQYEFCVAGPGRDRILICRDSGRLAIYDMNLKSIKEKYIGELKTHSFETFDLDKDGEDEIIFPGTESDQLAIFSNDLREVNLLTIPMNNYPGNLLDIRSVNPFSRQLVLFQGDRYHAITYRLNFLRYLKYPVYGGIYLAILLFIFLVRYLQRRTLSQKYEAERKISALQLLLLKNQVDPHFTFNAINAVSASILKEEPETANRNLLALSGLIRASVTQSDKLSRSLAEELDFLKRYIDFFRERLHEDFSFSMEVREDVDLTVQVPKMILQIHAENAIRHGLMPLQGGGKLDIRVAGTGAGIVIEIEDNGIGRKRAAELGNRGAGKGLAIIRQTIDLFNRYNSGKIRQEITDLEDASHNPCGTLVRITIPAGMRYNLL